MLILFHSGFKVLDDIYGVGNDGILCRKGLADPLNEETFLEELKDKWNTLEKKSSSANMSYCSFFEYFKCHKADIMISSMAEAPRKGNGM